MKCYYCGGNCPNEPEDSRNLCDGFAGDIDNLYEEVLDQRDVKRRRIINLILASIFSFNLGALIIVFSDLDWIGWLILALPILLWFPLPKPK
jgi:hypothetical protein